MTAVAMTTTGPGRRGPAPLVSQQPSQFAQQPLHARRSNNDNNAINGDSAQQAARRHQHPATKTSGTSAQPQQQGRGRASSLLATINNSSANPSSNSKKPSLKVNHGNSRGASNGLITIPSLGKAAVDNWLGIPVPPALRMAKDTVQRVVAAAPGSATAQNRGRAGGSRSPTQLGRSRSGRQFTVGNIGHNGLLYLRPVIRPATELQRQRQPMSPLHDGIRPSDRPVPAGGHRRRNSSVGHESMLSSIFSYRRPQDAPKHRNNSEESGQLSPSRRPSHARSHSFSTMDDRATREGTYKVIIRSASERHPNTTRTSEDTTTPDEVPNMPLQVNIPSFRLGKPHFGLRGSADLISTAYTRNSAEESKSPDLAQADVESAPSSYITLPDDVPAPLNISPESAEVLVPRAPSLSPSPRVSITEFAMHVFDELSYNSDDSSVVRFSPVSHDIVAATPSRLVAHITSPNFLDYELLSDFFLTFRAFLLPTDLVSFLLARLRWAVERVDDFGRIVRVRTFVALRHWILNYFSDDFAPDFALRVHFCDLVNGLFQDLQRRADGGGGDIKIIGELKKCWRRTCGLFWPLGKTIPAIDEDIYPGGRIESAYWHGDEAGLAQLEGEPKAQIPEVVTIKQRLSQRLGDNKTEKGPRSVKSTPRSGRSTRGEHETLSPTSIQSLHVISCSIPIKPIYKTEPSTVVPLFPHPVLGPIESISNASYPAAQQKKNESSTDVMRGGRTSGGSYTEKAQTIEEIEDEVAAPGSLVHGALYQPSSPIFEIKTTGPKRQALGIDIPTGKVEPGPSTPIKSPNNSDSMKKIFGSVRRAISTNLGLTSHPVHPSDHSFYPNGRYGSGTNLEVPGSDRGTRPSQNTQVRIDLLCSIAGDRFRLAVEAERSEGIVPGFEQTGAGIDGQAIDLEQALLASLNVVNLPHPQNRSVTVGSRSIVIVDDTNSDCPVMSGALSPKLGTLPSPVSTGPPQSYHPRGLQPSSEDGRSDKASVRSGRSRSEMPQKGRVAALTLSVPGSASKKRESSLAESDRLVIRSSRDIFRNSMRSDGRPSTLRKYASYHSDFGGMKQKASYAKSDAAQPSPGKSTDTNDTESASESTPRRRLRRRPGGNLKAVSKVHDLETRIPRRHSIGSISTLSKSMPGSLIQPESKSNVHKRTITPIEVRQEGSAKSKGEGPAATSRGRNKSISLILTHSSQPNLRPSFEAEVAKLKALPDDDDDGGVESTLLKLEGKYEKKSPESAPVTPLHKLFSSTESPAEAEEQKHQKHHAHVEVIHPDHPLPRESEINPHSRSIYYLSNSTQNTSSHVRNQSNATSDAPSYDSIPILERGQGKKRLQVTNPSKVSSSDSPSSGAETPKAHSVVSPSKSQAQESVDVKAAQPTTELQRNKSNKSARSQPRRRVNAVTSSFLLDDAQELSDDEVFDSVEEDDDDYDVQSFLNEQGLRSEQRIGNPLRHPDTPPERLVPRLNAISQSTLGLSSRGTRTTQLVPSLPHVPPLQPHRVKASQPGRLQEPQEEFNEKEQPLANRSSQVPPPHLPFILAYPAEHMAQQFTLLEKDALDEIDWCELIELRWNQTPAPPTDWVTYLRSSEPFGVGLVIARFNLMVKWVISEILLTDSPQERARTIIHYIHIAAHCRRLRNFATMYQVSVALLSADCSRLKRTWALVPQTEVSVLHDLERVVQPLRNFHNLRMEMETAPADAGCIPFIGIYTRDLVYNAQKPLTITSEPQNPFEPMINFERHHTAANIVKSLLRLLEQSSKYTFTPDPVCLSRCLWMSALDESEIRKRSQFID